MPLTGRSNLFAMLLAATLCAFFPYTINLLERAVATPLLSSEVEQAGRFCIFVTLCVWPATFKLRQRRRLDLAAVTIAGLALTLLASILVRLQILWSAPYPFAELMRTDQSFALVYLPFDVAKNSIGAFLFWVLFGARTFSAGRWNPNAGARIVICAYWIWVTCMAMASVYVLLAR